MVTLKTPSGFYITAELDGSVVATRTEAGPWEQWEVVPLGGEEYALKSAHGKFLSARDEPYDALLAIADEAYAWEAFGVVLHGNGIALESAWDRFIRAEGGGGSTVDCGGLAAGAWEELIPSDMAEFGFGGPKPGERVMQPLQGEVLPAGRSFKDATGPRIVHGCSDFGALPKFNEDRDKYLRQLDVTAKYQQYTRLAWRLNGWKYTDTGLTVDPIRDSWFEGALRGVLQAHQDRGLKVNLSSFDMNNWATGDMDHWFRRVAEIASDYGDTVWLSALTNEMQGTWEPGETPEHVQEGHRLMGIWREVYGRGCWAVSDPASRSEEGMNALAGNTALIHDQRWEIHDAIRHCFNTMYENYPGCPVVQDEPTGPNGSPPYSDFTRLVYQPIEDHDELFALYTMMVLTGQAATYFNDPALVSREPLDSTWGFKELPELWRSLEIPQDIGQGDLGAGHTGAGLMDVMNSHAGRADSMSRGGYHLGVISHAWDGEEWRVKALKTGRYSLWYATGMAWEGHLSHGQVIPTPPGFVPVVVRCIE
jgi:hypothetical protein